MIEEKTSEITLMDHAGMESKQRAERFRQGGFAAILYAITTACCLYENSYGIMTVLFAAATVGFLYYVISNTPQSRAYDHRANDKSSNPHTILYFIGIILLGISVFLTADRFLITCNYIGIYLLSLTVLFNCFCGEQNWEIGKYIKAAADTCISPFRYLFFGIGDGYEYGKLRKNKKSKLAYVLVGIAVALPFLVLVVVLLSQADIIFKYIVEKSIGAWKISGTSIGFFVMIVVCFVAFYGVYCKMVLNPPQLEGKKTKHMEPLIGITFCGLMTLLYAMFSVIQILTPFMGNRMLLEGYSYSAYARQGFFQLLYVAALNLILVLVCNRIFEENRILRGILTVMCGCTYIMIASSAVRIFMYIKEYNLTYLRVLVLFALLNLICLFAGTLISLYNHRFPLMKYMILVCGGIYILFSFSHPDAFVMKYNLTQERKEVEGWIEREVPTEEMELRLTDEWLQMREASADATEEVFAFVEWLQARGIWDSETSRASYVDPLLVDYSEKCTSRRGIRKFNISTYQGKLALENYLE